MDADDRCELHRQVQRLRQAYRDGDLAGVKAALGWPEDFPNTAQPFEYASGDRPIITAISHSPLNFIRQLLDLGADPNFEALDGFPSLIDVLQVKRPDQIAVLELLLHHGAEVGQRGINDWTALHYAVSTHNLEAVRVLLAAGADPNARTRIDDCTTPLEDARSVGFSEAVVLMGG